MIKLEVGKFLEVPWSQIKHVFLGEDGNHEGCYFFAPVFWDGKINFREQYVINYKNNHELKKIKEWQEPGQVKITPIVGEYYLLKGREVFCRSYYHHMGDNYFMFETCGKIEFIEKHECHPDLDSIRKLPDNHKNMNDMACFDYLNSYHGFQQQIDGLRRNLQSQIDNLKEYIGCVPAPDNKRVVEVEGYVVADPIEYLGGGTLGDGLTKLCTTDFFYHSYDAAAKNIQDNLKVFKMKNRCEIEEV